MSYTKLGDEMNLSQMSSISVLYAQTSIILQFGSHFPGLSLRSSSDWRANHNWGMTVPLLIRMKTEVSFIADKSRRHLRKWN
jgi:hypothetical protein